MKLEGIGSYSRVSDSIVRTLKWNLYAGEKLALKARLKSKLKDGGGAGGITKEKSMKSIYQSFS